MVFKVDKELCTSFFLIILFYLATSVVGLVQFHLHCQVIPDQLRNGIPHV